MAERTLLSEIEPVRSLVDALQWAQSRTPAAQFVDVVAQDEFTHDVIVQVTPGVFVVFDTT